MASEPSRTRHSTLNVTSASALEEKGNDFGQEHVLVQQDRPFCDLEPRVWVATQHVIAATDEQVYFLQQAVVPDEEVVRDVDQVAISPRHANVGDDVADTGDGL